MLSCGCNRRPIEHRSILDFNLKVAPRAPLLSGFAAGLPHSLCWWARSPPAVAALWPHRADGDQYSQVRRTLGHHLSAGGIALKKVCSAAPAIHAHARASNFWWALAAVAGLCLDLCCEQGQRRVGVYAIALLGVLPCFALHW